MEQSMGSGTDGLRHPGPIEDHYVVDRHTWVASLEGVVAYDKLPPARGIDEST